jgi:hypothetical protein
MGSTREGLDPLTWVMIVAAILVGLVLCVRGCEDRESAARTLKAAGFTDVELGPWQFAACGDDPLNNSFKATNPRGVRVSGVVCCGVFKRCTVRY